MRYNSQHGLRKLLILCKYTSLISKKHIIKTHTKKNNKLTKMVGPSKPTNFSQFLSICKDCPQ